jgi:hypothetical protein
MDIQLYVGADIAADNIQLAWQDNANGPHHQMTLKQQPRDYGHWVKQLTQQTAPEHVQVVLKPPAITGWRLPRICTRRGW